MADNEFEAFLCSMINSSNGHLIAELKSRWDEFKKSKQVPKDFSIISINKDGGVHSVRNLSNNDVLTLGDYAKYKTSSYYCFQIDNFFITSEGKCLARSIDNLICEFVDKDLVKVADLPLSIPPNQNKVSKPIPLFFSEDEHIPIYEGDMCYQVSILEGSWKCSPIKARKELAPPPSYFKYFYTPDAAKEYILMNKPMLSLKMIEDYWKGTNNISFLAPAFELLKGLAQSKIK